MLSKLKTGVALPTGLGKGGEVAVGNGVGGVLRAAGGAMHGTVHGTSEDGGARTAASLHLLRATGAESGHVLAHLAPAGLRLDLTRHAGRSGPRTKRTAIGRRGQRGVKRTARGGGMAGAPPGT